jgi:hypothetical protein
MGRLLPTTIGPNQRARHALRLLDRLSFDSLRPRDPAAPMRPPTSPPCSHKAPGSGRRRHTLLPDESSAQTAHAFLSRRPQAKSVPRDRCRRRGRAGRGSPGGTRPGILPKQSHDVGSRRFGKTKPSARRERGRPARPLRPPSGRDARAPATSPIGKTNPKASRCARACPLQASCLLQESGGGTPAVPGLWIAAVITSGSLDGRKDRGRAPQIDETTSPGVRRGIGQRTEQSRPFCGDDEQLVRQGRLTGSSANAWP